jgi:hypothetical protein
VTATWRLDRSEIKRAVDPIPAAIDLDKLCSALDRAVHDYLDGTVIRRLCQWRHAQKSIESKAGAELQTVIRNIAAFDPDYAPRLQSVLHELEILRQRAKFEATTYGRRGRRKLLYVGVMRAWTNADGTLGASESGPLQRLLCFVAKKFNFRLSPRGAREAIAQEQSRREELKNLDIKFTAQASLSAEAYIIDASGKRKD